MKNLTELYDALDSFDWSYALQDSYEAWKRGQARKAELSAAAAQIEGGKELMSRYEEWRNSTLFRQGSPLPKPERP